MKRIAVVFGTRPEAIKMAPVIRELGKHAGLFECRICLTGQHREMLDQVLKVFQIHPHADLDLMTPSQDLVDITGRVLRGLREYFQGNPPDFLLVQGDTTTTFGAALAAFYHRVPVGHVEAGLRTGRRDSPFPEEINRRLVASLADLHFAPTSTARDNLLREGIDAEDILVTGNTAIDALHLILALPPPVDLPVRFQRTGSRLLVTAHRRESYGEGIARICGALRRIAETRPEVEILYPVHRNPSIREPVRRILHGLPNVTLCDPLEYDLFVHLMAQADIILTDSGGIQEEAPSLGKPVLVLRDTTERPEAVEAGTVRIVGTNESRIVDETLRLLDDPDEYARMARAINPYGDGQAAPRIVQGLRERLERMQTDPPRS